MAQYIKMKGMYDLLLRKHHTRDNMKIAQAGGFLMTPRFRMPKLTAVTVRTETTNDFSTLSLADDTDGFMIQVSVTPEVKRILKGICK